MVAFGCTKPSVDAVDPLAATPLPVESNKYNQVSNSLVPSGSKKLSVEAWNSDMSSIWIANMFDPIIVDQHADDRLQVTLARRLVRRAQKRSRISLFSPLHRRLGALRQGDQNHYCSNQR